MILIVLRKWKISMSRNGLEIVNVQVIWKTSDNMTSIKLASSGFSENNGKYVV